MEIERNEHIDNKYSWLLILAMVLMAFSTVFLLILFIGLIFRGPISFIQSVSLLIAAYALIRFLARRKEEKLNQKMLNSGQFELMLNSYDFKPIDQGILEGNMGGYYAYVFNIKEKYPDLFDIQNSLYVDLETDCSKLSKKEIRAIEKEKYIVTHTSIRYVVSSWEERYNVEKISSILTRQISLAKKFNLKTREEILAHNS